VGFSPPSQAKNKESRSFLKKRTKKLLSIGVRTNIGATDPDAESMVGNRRASRLRCDA
jgi:hypothetical protein